MLFSPNQIVGLIEIETPDSADARRLSLGAEEDSLAGLLTWLTGAVAAADEQVDLAAGTTATNRLTGMFAGTAAGTMADSVPADLGQLALDLDAATAQLRLELVLAAGGPSR